MELYALQDIVEPLRELGATLVALSPQKPEHGLSIIEKNKLTFDILSDPENAYAAKLGLRFDVAPELKPIYQAFGIDLAACNGDPSWTLPMPARLVIDKHGIVRAADIDPDYTVRPEPQKTLDDVKRIVG